MLLALFFTVCVVTAFAFGWLCADISRMGDQLTEDKELNHYGDQ